MVGAGVSARLAVVDGGTDAERRFVEGALLLSFAFASFRPQSIKERMVGFLP